MQGREIIRLMKVWEGWEVRRYNNRLLKAWEGWEVRRYNYRLLKAWEGLEVDTRRLLIQPRKEGRKGTEQITKSKLEGWIGKIDVLTFNVNAAEPVCVT